MRNCYTPHRLATILLLITSFIFGNVLPGFVESSQQLAGENVDLEAVFRALSQEQNQDAQALYAMYIRQQLKRRKEFERFVKYYPEIEQQLLAALQLALDDPNLAQRIRGAAPGASNAEILNALFPGLSLSAMTGSPAQPVQSTPEASPDTPQAPVTAAGTGERGSLVFLDTSGSMKGYFGPENAPFNFQKFLQTEFRNVLSSREATTPLFLCRFGKTLDPVEQVKGFAFTLTDFPRSQTDIIQALDSELFGAYQLSVVITDGIQSDKAPGANFDIGNLLRAVKRKADQGYYLYLIGVLADFKGKVYSEMVPEKIFQHQGQRPIFIWLAARNQQLGSEVADAMLLRLRQMLPPSSVAMTRVNDVRQPKIGPITVERGMNYSPQPGHDPGLYTIFALEPGRAAPDTLVPLNFDLLQPEDGWSITLKLSPQVEWASLENGPDGWHLKLDYKKIPARQETPLTVSAVAEFAAGQQWWQAWSTTDDTVETNTHQTLYLQRLVERTIEPFYSGERELGSVRLIISRQ